MSVCPQKSCYRKPLSQRLEPLLQSEVPPKVQMRWLPSRERARAARESPGQCSLHQAADQHVCKAHPSLCRAPRGRKRTASAQGAAPIHLPVSPWGPGLGEHPGRPPACIPNPCSPGGWIEAPSCSIPTPSGVGRRERMQEGNKDPCHHCLSETAVKQLISPQERCA